MNDNCDKNEKIKALEVTVSKDSLKLLQILFAELNICASDLDSLVTVCSDLHKGSEINVCNLLGTNSNTSENYFGLFYIHLK